MYSIKYLKEATSRYKISLCFVILNITFESKVTSQQQFIEIENEQRGKTIKRTRMVEIKLDWTDHEPTQSEGSFVPEGLPEQGYLW